MTQAAFDAFYTAAYDDSDIDDLTRDDLTKTGDPAFLTDAVLAAIVDFKDPKDAAPSLRLIVLLQAAKAQWTDRNAFGDLLASCTKSAATEEATFAALGMVDLSDPQLSSAAEQAAIAENDPQVSTPEAFPETWARYLGKYLTSSEASNYPQMLEKDAQAAWDALGPRGNAIPGDVLRHGLPLDFDASSHVEKFRLYQVAFVAVMQWLASPSGELYGNGLSLLDFALDAMRYLKAVNMADFANLWVEYAKTPVQQVRDGEITLNAAAYIAYKHRRPYGVSLQEQAGQPISLLVLPSKEKVDPAVLEMLVTSLAETSAVGKLFEHGRDVMAMAAGLMDDADQLIAKESGPEKVVRAQDWGHERGFYSESLGREWESVKKNKVKIAKGVAKDVALFTALQFIPGVDLLVDAYVGLEMLADVADTLGDFYAAESEAANATSAPELQRAAAHFATAVSATARKAAMFLAMHAASSAGKRIAGKKGGKGDPDTDADDVDDTPDDSTKPPDTKPPDTKPPAPEPAPAAPAAAKPDLRVLQGEAQGSGKPTGKLKSVPKDGSLPDDAQANAEEAEQAEEQQQEQQQELKKASGDTTGGAVMQTGGSPAEMARNRGKGSGDAKTGSVKPAGKGSGGSRRKGGGRGKTARYSPLSYKLLQVVVERFPKLEEAHVTIKKRGTGQGKFEETMFTGGGPEQYEGSLRDGRKVELDGLDPDGWVRESKMRSEPENLHDDYVQEYLDRHAHDPVDLSGDVPPDVRLREKAEAAADRRIDMIETNDLERFEDQLVRQNQFAKENDLPGVEWITDSPKAAQKMMDIVNKRGLGKIKITLID
jgi:hypothetical protein